MFKIRIRRMAGVFVFTAMAATTAKAQEATERPAASLEDRVEQLDQELRILNRKLEIEREEAATKSKSAPVISAGKEGFGLKSADNAFSLRFRGTLQADSRWYIDQGEAGVTATDNFLIRRLRPVMEGTLYEKYGFRIMPEFAGSSFSLLDLFLDANFTPGFRIRAGKFKGPVGLERLQSPSDLLLVERAFPTQLLPNRDNGVQIHGDVFNSTLNYAAGLFDGSVDGASGVQDNNDGKDFEGRLYARPFRNSGGEGLSGLNFGVAYTRGGQQGSTATGGSNLPAFLTPGQQTFFTYATGAFANGERTRISPQLFYAYGPFGLMGEYAVSRQKVTRAANLKRSISNKAWQLTATYVLTGEDAGYTRVSPRENFDWTQGTWGAFELVARVSVLKVDDEVFSGSPTQRLADPTTQAKQATDHAIGLNWHLNRAVKVVLNYEQTHFEGGAGTGDRPDEKVVFTRFQIAY